LLGGLKVVGGAKFWWRLPISLHPSLLSPPSSKQPCARIHPHLLSRFISLYGQPWPFPSLSLLLWTPMACLIF
jgi:hypothetical protein